MTQRIRENFSAVEWRLVTIMGNTMPPRDPNDAHHECYGLVDAFECPISAPHSSPRGPALSCPDVGTDRLISAFISCVQEKIAWLG